MEVMDMVAMGITFLLGLGAAIPYISKVTKLLKEVAEVLLAIEEAVSDKAISKAEIKKIVQEAQDVLAALKAFKK